MSRSKGKDRQNKQAEAIREADAQPPPSRRPGLAAAICAALVILTAATLGGILSNGFINFDDPTYVTENAHVKKGLSPESLKWVCTAMEGANWHPVTWISHMLDVQIFGLDAGHHHLTSLAIHALNAVLLLLLLAWMTEALWPSAFVAALFAIHPLHVESVAWVAERKDVLSTLFWFLTLLAWVKFVRVRRPQWFALALVAFTLGLMSKPMLVTLPFTLLLLDYWPLRRLTLPLRKGSHALKGLLIEKAPFFVLSAASCVMTFLAQTGGGAVRTLDELSYAGRVANVMVSYASYLGKMIWPSALCVFYPYPHGGHSWWAVAGSAIVFALGTVMALRFARQAPYAAFGWFWYVGTLVPVIGLVQVGAQAMADRYTYVPLIGLFVSLAWGLSDIAGKGRTARRIVVAGAVAFLVACAFVDRSQVRTWSNNETLWGRALAVTSENYMAHDNLGIALSEAGDKDGALRHFREATRIRPDFASATFNIGLSLLNSGRPLDGIAPLTLALEIRPGDRAPRRALVRALIAAGHSDEAIPYLEEDVRHDPASMKNHLMLAGAFSASGKFTEGIEQYEKALALKPDDPAILLELGQVFVKANRLAEARERFARAVQLKPDSPEAHNNLGAVLEMQDRTAEAFEQFALAQRLKPGVASTLDNLGLVLARMNRLTEAIGRFEEAAKIEPVSAEVHNHLGIALMRANRNAEAMEQFREALRLKPDLAEARANLQRLQSGLKQ